MKQVVKPLITPETYPDNDRLEQLVDILCQTTQKNDRHFARINMLYHLAKMASELHYTLVSQDSGKMVINMYALALAPSGYGKGRTVNIIKKQLTKEFNELYANKVFPNIAQKSIGELARKNFHTVPKTKKIQSVEDYEKELQSIFFSMGAFVPQFNAATTPGIKQYRQNLLMAGTGALPLIIDEVGDNILGETELLTLYLELYEEGETENKIIKSSAETHRTFVLEGSTPAVMLLYGTPASLLDGSKVQIEFEKMLKKGYARRLMFAYAEESEEEEEVTMEKATEIFEQTVRLNDSGIASEWSEYFADLAEEMNNESTIQVPRHVSIFLNLYRKHCEKLAKAMPEEYAIRKAEMQHRHSKAIKTAGILAFLDKSPEVLEEHLKQAIKIVEQSGVCFNTIIKREAPHIILCNYLACIPKEQAVSQADMMADVSVFNTTKASDRKEMLELAADYGNKHGILIKKDTGSYSGLVKYYSEVLEETSLNALILSTSYHEANDYKPVYRPFSRFRVLGETDGAKWCNHHFQGNHRNEDNAIDGFNTIVLDVDSGINREIVHHILRHWTFMTHTTKRHTPEHNRFRVIMPTKYKLNYTREQFKTMMSNLYDYLPFGCDEATNQRSRMWSACKTPDVFFSTEDENSNPKQLIDPLRFSPSTDQHSTHMANLVKAAGIYPGALQRFFAVETKYGNRNNMLFNFAMTLFDMGKDIPDIQKELFNMNGSLDIENRLSEEEIQRTILVTLVKKKENQTND